MANKIVLDVNLKSKIEKAQGIYNKIDQGKGFSGVAGKEAQAKFQGNWTIIERLLKQTELSEDEFKQLNAAVKNVFSVLNTYASKIESLSEKAIALQRKIDKQLQVRNKAEEDRNTQREKVSNKKIDLINAIGDKEIHTITKNGKLSGGGALKAETVASKLDAGVRLGYKDENGNIQEISSNSDIAKLSSEYIEAQTQLSKFEIALEKANAKLDQLSETLRQQIETDKQSNPTGGASLVTEVMDIEKEVRQGFSETKESFINDKIIHQEEEAVKANTKAHQENSSALGKAFKQFTLYSIALRTVKRALREAVSTVKELDKELTEQAMVTGLTREQTYKLVRSYQDLAAQTGATTKEVANVATEYMKQGKSINEALTLTEAAVSAAKVANVSTADSVNYLTTALNGFQLSANDAMLVSDKFAAVAAASATDYDELAIALSKVASQANLAGMSIDYTTALLTKGLETTREAPETMGTALKTIIARMRELGDYGETLEGDTDINNVESQLAYVGIALRNTEGELRSTEDVLDDLGKKWDTLDKNQQAAVAKALAGTRQQSRLIAMMTDYERVTELQEIAARSAGATAAQAGVYLEGIEAALNKITIAWEKIVTSVTDSEIIVNTLSFVGDSLSFIGEFLSTDWGLISTLTMVGVLASQALGAKMREAMYAQHQQKLERENLKIQLKLRKSQLEGLKTQAQDLKTLRIATAVAKQKAVVEDESATEAEKAAAVAQYKLEEMQAETEYQKTMNDLEIEELSIEGQLQTLGESQSMTAWNIASATSMTVGGLGSLVAKSGTLLTIMTMVSTVLQAMPALIALATKAQQKHNDKTLIGALLAEAEGLAKFWPWGVFAAAALLALVGVGVAISNTSSKTQDSADEVNKLSNEIYKLNEKVNAIDQITDAFDKLDNKIIKTNKDIEEMSSLLEQAADSLSDEIEDGQDIGYGVSVSEKAHYQSLGSEKLQREFLDTVVQESRNKIAVARQKQIQEFKDNPELLNENTTDAQIKKAQSSLYANAIYNLQNYIDELKETGDVADEAAAAVEKLTQTMIEEATLAEAQEFSDNQASVRSLVDSIKTLNKEVTNTSGKLQKVSMAEILTSDDYGIKAKAEAFRDLKNQLGAFSDEYKLLEQAYLEYSTFAEMNDDILEMIDNLGISVEDIGNLQESWSTLKKEGLDISQNEYKDLITSKILPTLATSGGDIGSTIDLVFGKYLTDAKTYEQTYNAIVNSFSQIIGQGMLNMGQSITKLKNTVNSFYEKATEWTTMSDQEKSEFMSENATLFKGQTGVKLLNALNTNSWREMEGILKQADGMQDQIEEKLKWIETELSIEEARIGEVRNEAYIQQLKAWKNELEDSTNFFRADLQLLLDQEQAQLDIYRDYLEKQQEQLEESLDKRKEAYEKYFEAINQQQEGEDYQEQSNKLVANLSKLASSTDMASKKQAKELKQQLEDLEKERQETLRQRTQDAVMESIDSEVEEINKKFDELLNNEQLLLEALQAEQKNPNFLTALMASAREEGMTDLQLEDFANQINSAFGSSIDTSNVQEIMEQIQNNATINIGDQTFDLNSEDGNTVWETILAMLVKYGYGR